jgi:hypothetical protein
MAVKLGDDDVSFRFGGIQVDAIYLGTEEVWSAVPLGPATLYFNGAVDGDWTTLGNWWLNPEHTSSAGRLPTSADSVVASATVTASGQTVVDFAMNDPEGDGFFLNGTLTVSGVATFNGFSNNSGTITGNAVFNDDSANGDTVTGDAAFNDNSFNSGNVTGTATFTGSACNFGGTAGTFDPHPPPSC